MASILKVDTLQKPDGSTPTAADLGIDVAGTIVQSKVYTHYMPYTIENTSGSAYISFGLTTTFTPKQSTSTIVVMCSGITARAGSGNQGSRFNLYKDGVSVSGVNTVFLNSTDTSTRYGSISIAESFTAGSTNQFTLDLMFNSWDDGQSTQILQQYSSPTMTILEIAQ